MDKTRLQIIIRMEWMKTWCRMNLIFLGAIFLFLLLQVGLVMRVELSGDDMVVVADSGLIYHYVGRYISNVAYTFIPIMLLVNIGREFDFAVVQRSLVSGISRKAYFVGKIFQLLIFSLGMLLIAVIFTILASLMYQVAAIWDFQKSGVYVIVAFCLGSLALMLVFILKKRFHAMAAFIAYVLLENTLSAIMSGRNLYLPYQTCIRLLRQGIYGWTELVMVTVYTFVFLAVAWRVFRRRDLL